MINYLFRSLMLLATTVAILLSCSSLAQVAPGFYRVYLKDKTGTPYSLDNPSAFLSPATIERRIRQGIGFDEKDLPVNPAYIQSVLNLGNLRLHHASKWFNSLTVQVVDTSLTEFTLDLILSQSFVASVRNVSGGDAFDSENEKWRVPEQRILHEVMPEDSAIYGPSYRQIALHNGHVLHELGYSGKGIKVAMFDAGWVRTRELPAFHHLYDNGQILGTRDFVSPGADSVYDKSTHGTLVLGHIAGIIPDSLLGTGPGASFYFFRTEDVNGEYLIEEDNWIVAAEYADSLGVDIIQSSLGYSVFDDSTMNHIYADLDGGTAPVTLAADIAASKGMLVVSSAGNSGDDPWYYITPPADADSILAVGAVGATGEHAFFSGYGPSSDGRVKPDVMAMGYQSVYPDLDSTINRGNGTSFSAPVITGLTACLWEAFPERTNHEIMDAIRRSSSLYHSPNDSMGYGIPDFWKAFEFLRDNTREGNGALNAQVYPNPSTERLTVLVQPGNRAPLAFNLWDISGRLVKSGGPVPGSDGVGYYQFALDISDLYNGMYFLELYADENRSVIRVEKIGR